MMAIFKNLVLTLVSSALLVTPCFSAGLTLESPAFASNAAIPQKFTCSNLNYSPPLIWHDPNLGTQSYVLIVHDPDAPTGNWIHWVLFNIPAQVKQLTEGATTPAGATSGLNSWNTTGYSGPCPPAGTHRYYFTLYALDTYLNLGPEATAQDVVNAMKGDIIDTAELVGHYSKNASK
ncbi:TPA: YbhB/YbcL family Raf kinase inhibitor-like protein [Legionella pneumophila]|nr:YbhB/YbcL family Raf kinase inhibitor-like protein [Legionella pneumophila]HAT8861230.1 YbhB/YbcL family Raf kinase inhibitor-like protein [Legionella pneumophila subsp. pneumophila]HAT6822725.1 YbhB/YbcL family Raf kinase inhibitor-like protein [Legionella pneumophila]HAT6827533.1 YbhB/YbcL family Raf kinase inhibitor-like protein [Legionella pneumophila]HAT6892922.1 YbhB/YbcL family Raf kinase inhibitor-like protein [Legionella pneumophila]